MTNRIIKGPSITIGEEILPVPDLFDDIAQALIEDTEEPDEINESMLEAYQDATESERLAIDRFIAAYCGLSVKTLLKTSDADDALLTALGITRDVEDKPTQDGG